MKRNSIASGIAWKLIERFSVQVMRFALQIVLARILDPEHYGFLTLMVIFTTLANVFIQKGFSASLVQDKDVMDEDYSSVFWASMGFALFAYAAIFGAAPLISRFYGQPELVKPLRVLAILVFPGALNSVQQARESREMNFKIVFFSNVGGVLTAGVVSIVMACMGFGLWSLVVQSVMSTTVSCILLRLLSDWKIRPVFNWSRVKVLFSFGWKLLVSELMDTLYQDLHSLVIGVKFDSVILGLCNRGKQFPQFVVTAAGSTVQSVMLPAMSRRQDDLRQLKDLVRSTVSLTSLFIFPVMLGLGAVAEPLVNLALTDKWHDAVPYLQIYCLSMTFIPIQTGCLQGINAVGRSDMFLKISLVKTGSSLAALIAATILFESPLAIACVTLVSTVCSCIINTVTCRKVLGYGIREQIQDTMPSLAASAVMLLAVVPAGNLPLKDWQMLIVQVGIGAAVYAAACLILRIPAFFRMLEIIEKLLGKSRPRQRT